MQSSPQFPELEQERQQFIDELIADEGPQWADSFVPGTFGCHELLDRLILAAENLEGHVRTHPACVQNAEWFALADQAVTALHELYQRVGAEHLEKTGDENEGQ